MKIKVRPDDFVVEEIIDLIPSKRGRFTLLRLKKQYWNTLDVIDFVARKFNVSKKKFSRAGLKDRYSLSTQYLTYNGDFTTVIKEKNFSIEPAGRVEQQISPDNLIFNRFLITLRDIDFSDIEKMRKNYAEVIEYGFPNYFDEQRFGSARHKKGFFAHLLMRGHYRGALKLLLCYPYKEDNIKSKIFKKYCLEHWGNWTGCLELAPKEFKQTVKYLVKNTGDYKGAIKTIDREMLNLYLLAYQSYLFNKILGLVVKDFAQEIIELPYSVGVFIYYRKLKSKDLVKKFMIPMMNNKTVLNKYLQDKVSFVFATEGITQRDFALSKIRFRGVRFKTFLRKAFIMPEDFFIGKPEVDEIYKNRMKLTLDFKLPAGSYATILLKRLLI